MRLAKVLESRRQRGEKSFVAYITAGDPNVAASEEILFGLERAGADVIELGVPFSDPVADGPTNLKAATRALQSRTSLAGVLKLAASARRRGLKSALVLFTYYNPVLRFGLETFAAAAAESGIDGALIVDLPVEEAGDYLTVMRARNIDTIFLASPTTTPDRLQKVAEASRGFLYYVARTGVTGTSQGISSTLASELQAVRKKVALPICVGFGISSPEQVASIAALADGVIVGSRLVQMIEAGGSTAEIVARVESEAGRLVKGLRKDNSC